MRWIVSHIKWIMLAAGLLTSTMLYAAIAPEAALRSSFGEGLEGPLAQVVVRSWGVLIALVGVQLIHGAFHPASRRVALAVAGISKTAFIALVLTHGRPFLGRGIELSVVVDGIMVLLFLLYLLATRERPATA